MKKKVSFLLTASLFLSVFASFTPYNESAINNAEAAAVNLMANGGFDQTTTTLDASWAGITTPAPVSWGLWIPTGSGKAPNKTANVALDLTTYHEGTKSLMFDAFATSRVSVNQSVTTVSAGKSYRLSMWVKTDNVVGTGAYFRTQYYNTSKVGDGPASPKLLGTNDWRLQQVFMTIPASTTKLVIEPFLETGTGKVWFDDISLEEYNGLTGITLDQTAFSMSKDGVVTLTPTFAPANAADKSVVWSSSNPNVASVDSNGNVTGKGVGTATIMVATPDSTIKAQSLVNVEATETYQAYNDLRLKWYDKLTGGALYNPADLDIQANITTLTDSVTNGNATGYWDTLNKSVGRTSLWSDLTSTTDSAQISTAYGRLKAMALAHSLQGSSLYQNEALRNDILGTLDWLYANRYNESKSEYGNWWDWEIGTPQILNDILVFMYDFLSPTQLTKNIKAIDHFVPDPKKRAANSSVTEVGANLLDKALVVTMRGVIGKNGAKITQGRDAIGPEFVYSDHGDGVYKDGSLVQHTNIAYTAGYGSVWLNRAADMTYLLNRSPWSVTDPNVNNVYQWVSDTFEPVIYKGLFMDMVNGRGMSRQASGSARGTILTLLRLAEGAPSDVALSIKRMAKEWILSDTTIANYVDGLPIYELSLVKNLMSDSSVQPRGELIKNQVYAGMDRVVHLRDGFGFGLSLFSNRISAFEKGNNENLKGWYTGIGMTYLYDQDLTQYRNDFWPTVDSFRLPGTTTNGSGKGVTPGEWTSYLNEKNWVGGSTIDGLYGAAGMDFSLQKVTGSDLQGKKSWFMFDDEIVALGAGISSTKAGPQPVETIIDNRKLNDSGDNALTINGVAKPTQLGWSETMNNVQWAHLAGNVSGSDMGYYFPESSNVYGLREARTGAWSEINSGQSTAQITRDYVSLAFEHGATPSNAAYTYVILPHKDAAATELYSQAPDIEILSNSTDVHAVREKKLGITAVNFWNPASVDFITAQNPASLMVKESESQLSVAVSDPTQTQNTISIELNKHGLSVVSADDTISVLQTVPTLKLQIRTAGTVGKSHNIIFKKDTSAPVTTDDAQQDWQHTAQTVTLTATDDISGVQKTFASLDNAEFTESNSIVVAGDGVHLVRYYSIDHAGNQEAIHTATVRIDSTGPVIMPTVSMNVYWTDRTHLQFDISDSISGVSSETLVVDGVQVSYPYTSNPLSLRIGDHSVIVGAVDGAGNETMVQYVLHVQMDIAHLDEVVRYAYQQGWISNQGIYNSLLTMVGVVQQHGDDKQMKNAWNALENHIRAQSGKKMDKAFAEQLLEAIASFK
jgi:hyaluronate lyase